MAKRYRRRRGLRGPQFICDRTGRKHPWSEGVLEPGTGWFVHFSQSDGKFNLVDHPQNKPPINLIDGKPLPIIRNDTHKDPENFVEDEIPLPILDEQNQPLIFENGV